MRLLDNVVLLFRKSLQGFMFDQTRFYKLLHKHWPLFAVLFAAAFLRILNFYSFSLTNDELSALHRLRFDSLKEMLAGGAWIDGHPAGIQIFLFYWVKLAGNSPDLIRLPFLIAGVLAVFFAYKAANSWFGNGAGLLTAICVAFLQFPLMYSSLARPYAPAFMAVMLLAWCWIHVLSNTVDRTNAANKLLPSAGLFVAISIAIYSHYFAALMVVISFITGLFFVNKKNYKFFLVPYLAAALIFIPHVNFTLNHMSLGGVEQWLAKPSGLWLLRHLYVFFNSDALIIAVLILSIVFMGIKNSGEFKPNSLRYIAVLWFLLPFSAGFVYSVFVNSVLQDSVLLFSTPFIFFFAGSFLPVKYDTKNSLIMMLLGALILLSTVDTKSYFKKVHFADFEVAAAKSKSLDNKYGKDNICKVFNVNNPYYIAYFLGADTSGALMRNFNIDTNLKSLSETVINSPCLFLMYSRLKPDISIIHDVISARFPYIIEYEDYDGAAEFFLYSRIPFETDYKSIAPKMVIGNGFEGNSRWQGELMYVDTIRYRGELGARLKPVNEFGPSWIVSTDSISQFQNLRKIKTEVFVLTENVGEIQLVLSVENRQGEVLYWSSSRADLFISPGYWSKVIHTATPELFCKDEIIKVYIWNPSGENLVIDDFSISIY